MSYYHQDQRDAAVGIGCVVLAFALMAVGLTVIAWCISCLAGG